MTQGRGPFVANPRFLHPSFRTCSAPTTAAKSLTVSEHKTVICLNGLAALIEPMLDEEGMISGWILRVKTDGIATKERRKHKGQAEKNFVIYRI